MTDNNGKDANEISANKGADVVHIDKNGAEENLGDSGAEYIGQKS